MAIDLVEIGARIQNRRYELGFTQQMVYEKLDISQNHYSRIENGHVGMSFEILIELAEILDVSTDYILTGKISSNDSIAFLEKYNSLTKKQKTFINDSINLLIESDMK